MFDPWRGFREKALSPEWHRKLTDQARTGRGQIIKMTTVAASGHPGGSMSSLELFLTLYNFARVDPKNPYRDSRDRIIVSHGHTSPGVYVALAAASFFDIGPALHGFRQAGSPFEGHVERSVPGVEWDTGNLGQGLSVGLGKGIYGRLSRQDWHTYVVMGDGEQQKGQIGEARCAVVKYGFSNITAIIDYNGLQISGKLSDIMPQQIRKNWEADGWRVLEIDAHDLNAVYQALYATTHDSSSPFMILAHSIMGRGVSFMENDESYHGAALSIDQARKALIELGCEDDLDDLFAKRKQGTPPYFQQPFRDHVRVEPGAPITYRPEDKLDNRSAWGKALVSVADANMGRPDFVMAVFDCDLSKSVKTDGFARKHPSNFFQFGITEHSTASTAGSLSAEKALSVWSDFGVFGIDETYNQARLNDINHTNLKLFCTHSGVNVGEDGKTHQCIDYFALLNSTFGWKVITPADPNQTDRIVRFVLATTGNFAVIMGRSVVPMITDESGRPYFGDGYVYRYGRMEMIRKGEDVVLVSAGNILPVALQVWTALNGSGKRIALVSVSDWSDLHVEDIDSLAMYPHVVTLEDHNVKNGLGASLAVQLIEHGYGGTLARIGVTQYAASGKPDDLYKMLGLDAGSVVARISEILKRSGVRV